MPTTKRFLTSLASPHMSSDFYQSLQIPDPEDFPRPGDATGKSQAQLAEMVKAMGYEFDRHATHSDLYRHAVFPAAIVGIASTTSDVRASKNLLSEARGHYVDESIRLRNAIVVLAAIATGMATSNVAIAIPKKFGFLTEAMTRFLEDCPRGDPDKKCRPLSELWERWCLNEVLENFDEIDALSREVVQASAEERKERSFSSEMESVLKSATIDNGVRCANALRKLNKEFGLGAKSCLKKCGVPDDCLDGIAEYLQEDPEARMPQDTADKLEAYLQNKRDAKKGKKKQSGRSFTAKTTKPNLLEELEHKLKKLPTMDMLNIVSNQLSDLERRHGERETLLREALKDQIARADRAEAELEPMKNKVVELAKSAEIEAERADDLANKLDEARAAATDNTAVQKLISDLHVAVDGFRVKHAQADLEHIEEILLGFQVETGIEAEVKA